MADPEKEGNYQSVCGGLPPMKIKTLLVDGKETGIDRLDEVLAEVAQLKLHDDTALREALTSTVRQYNYVPPAKSGEYAIALLEEYNKRIVE
ncbi:MAG: NAC family transcription factor [Methanoregulaceae archaeon]